jgi:hypothetical protein
MNFLIGTMLYSGYLALYFMLLIKFEWREATIARYIEPLGHFISILFPLLLSSVAVAKDYINPMDILPGFCWIWHYPPNCHHDEEVECLRGGNLSLYLIGPMSIFLLVIIFIAMLIMVLKVRQTELRMRRYAGGRNSQLEMTKETGKQALFYIGAFFLTFFPIIMLQMLYDHRYRGYYFWFAVLVKFFTPLQGFFNAFIYLRKRFRELTEPGGSLSFLRTIIEAPLRLTAGWESDVAGDQQKSSRGEPNTALREGNTEAAPQQADVHE